MDNDDREHPTISLKRHERLKREAADKAARLRTQMDALARCFAHPDWGEARRYIEIRIQGHMNDIVERSKLLPEELAFIRGEITALRHLLKVADGQLDPLQGAAIDLLSDKMQKP